MRKGVENFIFMDCETDTCRVMIRRLVMGSLPGLVVCQSATQLCGHKRRWVKEPQNNQS